MRLRNAVVIFLGIVIQSCSHQSEEQRANLNHVKHIEMAIYRQSRDSGFMPTQTWTPLEVSDAAKLVRWLNLKDGWKQCPETYAPAKVFRGEGFNLNILPSHSAVLNHANDQGEWRQICIELKAEDADFFRQLLKEN
jgi:hypothetical protein